MYLSKLVEVSKAANGYVVSACVPLKPKSKGTDKMLSCCSSSADKQYIAKTIEEACQICEDLLPLLDQDFSTEKEFDAAFQEAAKNMSGESGENEMED